MALNDNSRDVVRHCEDFSYCLVNRYFQGYELDYDRHRVDAVKGLLDEYDGVKYLLVSNVTIGQELEPSLETVEFNRTVFHRVKTPTLAFEDESELEGEPERNNSSDDSNAPSM